MNSKIRKKRIRNSIKNKKPFITQSRSQSKVGVTVDEVESAHKKATEMLESIQSFEEFRAKKEEILTTILDGLDDALNNIKAMMASDAPTTEIQTRYDKLQKNIEIMENEIDLTLDNVAEKLNLADFVKGFKGEILGYSSPILTNLNFLRIDLMKRK